MNADVTRRLVRRLSLWDARRAQAAHPELAAAVEDEVAAALGQALRTPPPACLRAWLELRPSEHTRRHGALSLHRTRRDVTIQWASRGVCVTFYKRDDHAKGKLELRDLPDVGPGQAPLPTFDTLRDAAAALSWFVHRADVVHTRAMVHRPTREVLNLVLGRFARAIAV